MNKIFQSKNKIISDKAFYKYALTSILGIVVCIVLLCSTTFAWFAEASPYRNNKIKAADECLLSVTVVCNELYPAENGGEPNTTVLDETTEAAVSISEDTTDVAANNAAESGTESNEATIIEEDTDGVGIRIGEVIADIESGVMLNAGAYTVTLSLPANTASGYCIIEIGEAKFYTPYILRHDGSEPEAVSFTLIVNSPCEVTFTSHWGVYAGECSVPSNGELIIH